MSAEFRSINWDTITGPLNGFKKSVKYTQDENIGIDGLATDVDKSMTKGDKECKKVVEDLWRQTSSNTVVRRVWLSTYVVSWQVKIFLDQLNTREVIMTRLQNTNGALKALKLLVQHQLEADDSLTPESRRLKMAAVSGQLEELSSQASDLESDVTKYLKDAGELSAIMAELDSSYGLIETWGHMLHLPCRTGYLAVDYIYERIPDDELLTSTDTVYNPRSQAASTITVDDTARLPSDTKVVNTTPFGVFKDTLDLTHQRGIPMKWVRRTVTKEEAMPRLSRLGALQQSMRIYSARINPLIKTIGKKALAIMTVVDSILEAHGLLEEIEEIPYSCDKLFCSCSGKALFFVTGAWMTCKACVAFKASHEPTEAETTDDATPPTVPGDSAPAEGDENVVYDNVPTQLAPTEPVDQDENTDSAPVTVVSYPLGAQSDADENPIVETSNLTVPTVGLTKASALTDSAPKATTSVSASASTAPTPTVSAPGSSTNN